MSLNDPEILWYVLKKPNNPKPDNLLRPHVFNAFQRFFDIYYCNPMKTRIWQSLSIYIKSSLPSIHHVFLKYH